MKLKKLLEEVGLDAAQIYDVVPSAIFTVDKEKRITSWNKRAAEITGYTLEDVLGKPCSVLGAAACCKVCKLFVEEQPDTIRDIECVIKTKDGRCKKVSKNLGMLRDGDGKLIGAVESFEDISERKQAEEMMQKRADILNFIDHPIYVVNREMEYLFGNNKLIDRLNLNSIDDINGKTYGDFHTGEQTKDFALKIEEVFASGETRRYEYESRRGERGKYMRTLSPNKNREGKVVSVTISSDDISGIMAVRHVPLITICAYCKKIKNKKGNWLDLEAYFADKIDSRFTHGMCPACSEEAYKELNLLRQMPGKVRATQEL